MSTPTTTATGVQMASIHISACRYRAAGLTCSLCGASERLLARQAPDRSTAEEALEAMTR